MRQYGCSTRQRISSNQRWYSKPPNRITSNQWTYSKSPNEPRRTTRIASNQRSCSTAPNKPSSTKRLTIHQRSSPRFPSIQRNTERTLPLSSPLPLLYQRPQDRPRSSSLSRKTTRPQTTISRVLRGRFHPRTKNRTCVHT